MKYIIFAEEDEKTVLRSQSLGPASEVYLREVVLPALRPLSDEEYSSGPVKILSTAAPFSYVLDDEIVYWCVEWEPGLLVVKFAPDKSLAQAELPSPNPQFGGREATDEELENYDEDAENHQYNLVFDAWDAQFDEEELQEWEVVDEDTKNRFEAALAHVQMLGDANA